MILIFRDSLKPRQAGISNMVSLSLSLSLSLYIYIYKHRLYKLISVYINVDIYIYVKYIYRWTVVLHEFNRKCVTTAGHKRGRRPSPWFSKATIRSMFFDFQSYTYVCRASCVRARSARCARCPLGSRHFAVLRREEEERKTAGRAEYERVERLISGFR